MLFAEELEKADSTLLAVRAQRACTAGKLLFILFLICSPGQLSRMWRGRGCGCSGSQLGTSWHRVRNTITIKLCLASSHLHSPCSCQARLSARLSLYSQQPLNEPVHGVFNYTVLCMFVIPESQKTHQSWKGLQAPRAPEGAPCSSTHIVFSTSMCPQNYFAEEGSAFPCSVPAAGPVTAPALPWWEDVIPRINRKHHEDN